MLSLLTALVMLILFAVYYHRVAVAGPLNPKTLNKSIEETLRAAQNTGAFLNGILEEDDEVNVRRFHLRKKERKKLDATDVRNSLAEIFETTDAATLFAKAIFKEQPPLTAPKTALDTRTSLVQSMAVMPQILTLSKKALNRTVEAGLLDNLAQFLHGHSIGSFTELAETLDTHAKNITVTNMNISQIEKDWGERTDIFAEAVQKLIAAFA